MPKGVFFKFKLLYKKSDDAIYMMIHINKYYMYHMNCL